MYTHKTILLNICTIVCSLLIIQDIYSQTSSSANYKITTQVAGDGGSPVTPTSNALISTNYKAVVHVGGIADNLKTVSHHKIIEGYIPTLLSGTLPPPVITTTPKKTNDNTPYIQGTATPGATVRLYEGTTLYGFTQAATNGTWLIHNTTALPDGPYLFTAKTTGPSGESGPSNPLQLDIDTVPPAAPTNLRILAFATVLDLFWDANTEPDLLGYIVYRRQAQNPPQAFVQISDLGKVVATNRFRDTGPVVGVIYEYQVKAVDDAIDEKSQYHP
jgi:hypothetical protein